MDNEILKNAVAQVIKENGNEEITGNILQQVLIAMINALGAGFQFMGEATPDTAPGTPDARVFYFAQDVGTYSNFDGLVLDGSSVAFLLWSSSWSHVVVNIPTTPGLDARYLRIANLASSTGQSTDTAMTQKAVTDAIATINTALNGKVDKVEGKGLSTNDYTDSDKNKLEGLPNASQLSSLLGEKVDKVAGKGLSTNDFTDALKTLVENSLQNSQLVQTLDADAQHILSCAALSIVLQSYAKVDGWYSLMTVGAAENLVGRGSVPASFFFRTSGGTNSIGTGPATMTMMKGKSVVWNQLVRNGNFHDVSLWAQRNVTYSVADGEATIHPSIDTASAKMLFYRIGELGLVVGHKYYYSGSIKTESGRNCYIGFCDERGAIQSAIINNTNAYVKGSRIHQLTSESEYFIVRCNNSDTTSDTIKAKDVMLFDLSLMFGVGNEPSTVKEFEEMFHLDYYDYNAGHVLPFAAQNLVTTGFNQFNKDTVTYNYMVSTNGELVFQSGITASDYIPVFPGTTYYGKDVLPGSINYAIYYFDANKQYVGRSAISSIGTSASGTFTTPDNAYYIRVNIGNSFVNSACVNLSWSGYRNGEYEPYKKNTLIVNPAAWRDTDNELIFPYGGMHGVGSAFDFAKPEEDGYFHYGTRVFERVDLGSLNYTYDSNNSVFYANKINGLPSKANAICAKYICTTVNPSSIGDKQLSTSSYYAEGRIIIKDSAYNDTDAFKAAMSGVYLYYELATPVTKKLATPIPARYLVDDFGTEGWEPANTETPYTAPCALEIQYPMNAVDTLRNLPKDYISVASMTNFLAELGTAMNGTWTQTWDATNHKYTYSFTPNA